MNTKTRTEPESITDHQPI